MDISTPLKPEHTTHAIPTWWQSKSKAKGPHPIICDASNRNWSMFCRSRNQPKKYIILPKITNKTILILSILKHRTNCSIPIQKTKWVIIWYSNFWTGIEHMITIWLKHNSLNTIWLPISSATNYLIQTSNYLNIFCISCQYISSHVP